MKSPHFHPPARGQPLPAGRPGHRDRHAPRRLVRLARRRDLRLARRGCEAGGAPRAGSTALFEPRGARQRRVAGIAAAESLITVRESDLAQAKANLAQVQAGPRSVDLAALQAEVHSAQANVQAAQARLDNTRYRSF